MQEPIDHRINSEVPTKNEFADTQIKFKLNVVEFLRNRFVYDKSEYPEIESIEITSGYLIRNRWLIRLLSFVVIIVLIQFILYGAKHTGNFKDTGASFWFNKGAVISVWGPVILIVAALLAIFQSFVKSTVVIIKTLRFTKRISIKQLDKNREIDQLISFLRSKNVLLFDKRK